jgi:hypothetical protein
MHPLLHRGLEDGIFWVTKRIAIGQFVSEGRCGKLMGQGVTHVLNVGEAESLPMVKQAGFNTVFDIPIVDLERIPTEQAIRCIDSIVQVMSDPNAKLYIHCVACQNRSPTVLWLFLVACGMDVKEARRLIAEKCPDAVPGHPSLVDDPLVETVRAYAKSNAALVEDAAIIEPAY